MNIDIDAIKGRLLVKYPFFGSIIANLKYVETTDCYSNGHPTAGTDGDTIYYHPDFLKDLTNDEQVFIFAHEVCHVALDHIFRSEAKDPEFWNTAADAVINSHLVQDGLKIVNGGVDMPEAIDYDVEQFYQKLLEEKQKSQSNLQNSNQYNNSNKNKDVGHDTHSMWQEAIKRRKEQQSKQLQNDNGQVNVQYDKNKSIFLDRLLNRNKKRQDNKLVSNNKEDKEEQERKERLKQQVKRISEMGEKKIFKQNKIERKKQLEELRNSLAKQSVGYGTSTN